MTEEKIRPHGILAKILGTVPTIAILMLLGILGYWGHHTGWKLPKFSQLTNRTATQPDDWCIVHSVPESICVACRADLMPKDRLYGWCQTHGVAECVLEHADLAQLKTEPKISQEEFDRASRDLNLKPRSENDPLCKLHLRRIQFASLEAAEKAGIDIALVERGSIEETVSASGEIKYDSTRITRLASRAAGTVWRVERNIGDVVNRGDVLALVDAAAIGQAKAELLQAVAQLNLQDKTYQRLSSLAEVVAGRRLQEIQSKRAEAEAAVHKAAQTLSNFGMSIALEDVRGKSGEDLFRHLHLLGLPTAMSDELDSSQTTANLIPIVSPRDGVVVARDVVAGEVVETTKTLFTVVDNSRMWLILDVPLEDVQYVAHGQTVIFQPDGDRNTYEGQLTWISTEVDSETRTVKVRAELPNKDGQLRNESFGSGKIVIRKESRAILVPQQAIHWEGCCHVAFVRDINFLQQGSYKVFHTRMVRPGVKAGDDIEVIAGLLPGEVVVTKGSGILRAELLKGNLGAG